jgi:hypothetical protein
VHLLLALQPLGRPIGRVPRSGVAADRDSVERKGGCDEVGLAVGSRAAAVSLLGPEQRTS